LSCFGTGRITLLSVGLKIFQTKWNKNASGAILTIAGTVVKTKKAFVASRRKFRDGAFMITGRLDYLPLEFVDVLDRALSTNPRIRMQEEKGKLRFLVDGQEVPVNTLYYWYRQTLDRTRRRSADFLPPVKCAG